MCRFTGNTFTIINNDGAEAITNTFAGLAQGATISSGIVQFTISYTGGDGNDVVLTVNAILPGANSVPTLSEWALIIMALVFLSLGTVMLRYVPSVARQTD